MARSAPTIPTWVTGQQLTSSQLNQLSAALSFALNPPMFRAWQSTGQNIPSSAATVLTLDTIDYDTDSGWSAAAHGYVVPFSGRWRFEFGYGPVANTTGIRAADLTQNGTNVAGTGPTEPGTTPFELVVGTATITCNVGDLICVNGYQTSGITLGTSGGGAQASYLSCKLESLGNP